MPQVFLQSAQVETPFPTVPEVEIRLGREVAPAGFGWLVPFERRGTPHARIGLMAETQSRERFRTFAAELARVSGVTGVDNRRAAAEDAAARAGRAHVRRRASSPSATPRAS